MTKRGDQGGTIEWEGSPDAGETVDRLSPSGFALSQAKDGYRYSLDPVLLADFVSAESPAQIADLGTGNGVLPLLLAHRYPLARVVGVELQESLARRATRNVDGNGLGDRVQILPGDIRCVRDLLPAERFDLVVTNPPYRTPVSGRVAPQGERSAARHELAGGLGDFLAAAGYLLCNKGRFAIVYLAERLAELLDEMRQVRLEPKRVRAVHARTGAPAKMVLVEGRKCGQAGLALESPLFVYRGSNRQYTDEILTLYGKGRARLDQSSSFAD